MAHGRQYGTAGGGGAGADFYPLAETVIPGTAGNDFPRKRESILSNRIQYVGSTAVRSTDQFLMLSMAGTIL